MGNRIIRALPIICALALMPAGASLQAQPRVSAPPDSCGVLIGRVTDTSGMPVIGATIRLGRTKRGGYSKAPDGRFRIENIPADDYEITISAVGFGSRTFDVEIPMRDSVELIVELSSPSYQCDGRPLCCLPFERRLIIRDRAATIRGLSDISTSSHTSIPEVVRVMNSIRWFDPDGGAR